jgi:tetratricopeptide (TPR) repeat protein
MHKTALAAAVSIGLSGAASAARAQEPAVPADITEADVSAPAVPAPAVDPILQKKLDRGYRLAAEKKNTEAIAAFNSVLKDDPENHAALASLGYLYMEVKQWKSSIRNFQAATLQEPGDQRLRMDFAYALLGSGDLDGAATEFTRLSTRPGEYQSAARSALEELRNAVPPAELKGRKLLAMGYAALDDGDKAAARKLFADAAKADPKNTLALKQLGFLNFEAGRLQAAVENFEAVRAVQPDDYVAALQLGYTYAKLKKTDEAREAFMAASASTDAKIRDAATAALAPTF